MPSTRRLFPSVLAALTVLALLPGAAQAQSFAQLVWSQLQSAHGELSKNGFGSRRYVMATLNSGRVDTWTFNFYEGNTYEIRGACDEDCSDLDIEVTGLDNKVLFQDMLSNDKPAVSFNVTRSGDLKVKVTMRACSEEPCYWGIGIWSKEN